MADQFGTIIRETLALFHALRGFLSQQGRMSLGNMDLRPLSPRRVAVGVGCQNEVGATNSGEWWFQTQTLHVCHMGLPTLIQKKHPNVGIYGPECLGEMVQVS